MRKNKKYFYIGRKHSDGVKEGGAARDLALYTHLKKSVHFIPITKNKIWTIVRIYLVFIFSRSNTIVFHYPLSGLALSDRHLVTKIFRKILIVLLEYSSKNNHFIIDVADLPIEQANDLQLEPMPYYEEIENTIFSLNGYYIFASNSMRDFAIKKYMIDADNTEVCINGGNELVDVDISPFVKHISPSLMKFVYAGTLNKGRRIEEIVNLFANHHGHQLLLLGEEGEWLSGFCTSPNVIYLGALEESLAHKIVSLCDVGIIPYDSSKLYYNLAYPTKLSFYITAGITFLSTDVEEVKNINNIHHFGFIEKFRNWDKYLLEIKNEDIKLLKSKIKQNKTKFYWKNIYDIKKFKNFNGVKL